MAALSKAFSQFFSGLVAFARWARWNVPTPTSALADSLDSLRALESLCCADCLQASETEVVPSKIVLALA